MLRSILDSLATVIFSLRVVMDIGNDAGAVIVVLLAALILYMIWETYYVSGEVEMVKSGVDDREYLVQSLPDKQQAADLLATLRAKLERLIEHLNTAYSKDPRVAAIKQRINLDALSEGTEDTKYTSYSVNKGERIVFCLRQRGGENNNKLVDATTMTFVALHELAHVATESTGHTEEFWSNFSWILEEAIQIGVYIKQDFKTNPADYCGLKITNSPLDKAEAQVQA